MLSEGPLALLFFQELLLATLFLILLLDNLLSSLDAHAPEKVVFEVNLVHGCSA
jgi:hypothetical protein